MFTLAELEEVIPLVRASVPPTPQYAWPLLKVQTGVEVIVKHENHTPIGAFKMRGGIVYFDRLKRERPKVKGYGHPNRTEHRPCMDAKRTGWANTGCSRSDKSRMQWNRTIKLYDCTTAPSPRRARIFIAEKGTAVPTIQVAQSRIPPPITVERVKAMALLSIRMKRWATNDACAEAGCPTIKPATYPADIFSCGGGGERPV
jgi:hypothetical protein